MIAGKATQVQGLLLDEHAQWKFWRFDVSATLGDSPRQVEYALDADGLSKSDRCPLPTLPQSSTCLLGDLVCPAHAQEDCLPHA